MSDGGPTTRRKNLQSIGGYDVYKTLGEGTFAKVKLAVHRLSKQKVALKIIDKAKLSSEYTVKNVHREAQIMKSLQHPNIVRLFEVIETPKELILVLEYASGGEMLDYIVAHEKLKEAEARRLTVQIAEALLYCHDAHVVHRDLKAENILLDASRNVKISDFGLGSVYRQDQKLATFCGSAEYSSPEIIEERRYVGPEVDAWSLGVMIFAMVSGELPFGEKSVVELHKAIVLGKFTVPPFVSFWCTDLIKKLLVYDSRTRLNMRQVLAHPWLASERLPRPLPNFQRPASESELDPEILEKLSSMGLDGQCSATYFLLLDVKLRNEALASKYTSPLGSATASLKTLPETPNGLVRNGARARANTFNTTQIRPASIFNVLVPVSNSDDSTSSEIIRDLVNSVGEREIIHSVGTIPVMPESASPVPARVGALRPKARIKLLTQISNPSANFSMDMKWQQNTSSKDIIHSATAMSAQEMPSIKIKSRTPPHSVTTNSIIETKLRRRRGTALGVDIIKELAVAVSDKSPDRKSTASKVGDSHTSTKIETASTNSSVDHDKEHDLRSVRFAFSVSTASHMPLDQLKLQIIKALETEHVDYTSEGIATFQCAYKKEDSDVEFVVEVCKIPRLSMLGIRFKRTRGGFWDYKRICSKLMQTWEKKVQGKVSV